MVVVDVKRWFGGVRCEIGGVSEPVAMLTMPGVEMESGGMGNAGAGFNGSGGGARVGGYGGEGERERFVEFVGGGGGQGVVGGARADEAGDFAWSEFFLGL